MKSIVLTQSLSAGGTIRQLFRKTRPDRQPKVIASYDDYSHGPLLRFGTTGDFFLERNAYWKSLDLYDVDRIYEFDLTDEHISMVNVFKSAEHAEIWVTDSVQDMFYASVT